MATRIHVSNDLSVLVYGNDEGPGFQIQSIATNEVGIVSVEVDEIVALALTLQRAALDMEIDGARMLFPQEAAGMGIPTAQAELLAFAKKFLIFTGRDDYAFMDSDEFARCMNDLAEAAMAAIAKAEQ